MQRLEFGGEGAEEVLQTGPTLRWIECLRVDQTVVVVQDGVAVVTQ